MKFIMFIFSMIVASTVSAFAQTQTDDEVFNILRAQLNESEKTRGLKVLGQQQPSATDTENPDVVRLENELNIRVQFQVNSAVLAQSEVPALEQMCRVMSKLPEVNTFRIIGHTDNSGTAAYNAQLSKLRAEEVKRYLVDNCAVDTKRLRAFGYGEEFPIDGLDPSAPENRRVEFQAMG